MTYILILVGILGLAISDVRMLSILSGHAIKKKKKKE